MAANTIAILGAGPTGLALAHYLLSAPDRTHQVHVFEREPEVGGLSASFAHRGIWLDYGSHRLHPAAGERLLGELRALLGANLLERPRSGRIRLGGRFVGYPLRPLNLARNLPPSFAAAIARDLVLKPVRRESSAEQSYASVLRAALGPAICDAFYYPYAYKLWGLPAHELAADQAQRRVSAGSLGKLVRRLLAALPGFSTGESGQTYYYPKRGFGQICEALRDAIIARGGHLHLGAQIHAVGQTAGRATSLAYRPAAKADLMTLETTNILSTIPLPELARVAPWLPKPTQEACAGLRYRAMVYCYLFLRTDQLTPYDAHYFPESALRISRLSEPKNYSASRDPRGLTALCAELPCWQGDALWAMDDHQVADLVIDDLGRAGLPISAPLDEILVRRQRHAYPVYDLAFAGKLAEAERHIESTPGLVTLGRQGLFAHDNIHHAFEQARAAASALGADGSWDARAWQSARQGFRNQVVVD